MIDDTILSLLGEPLLEVGKKLKEDGFELLEAREKWGSRVAIHFRKDLLLLTLICDTSVDGGRTLVLEAKIG